MKQISVIFPYSSASLEALVFRRAPVPALLVCMISITGMAGVDGGCVLQRSCLVGGMYSAFFFGGGGGGGGGGWICSTLRDGV